MKMRHAFLMLIVCGVSHVLWAQMTVKDSEDKLLMEVNDEGDFGSIALPSPTSSTPSVVANKLYNVGGLLYWNGSVLAVGGNSWSLNGNGGTTPGTHFLGTTDNQALEFKVNNARILRLEPTSSCPNLIGGLSTNFVTAGAIGATISGGGGTNHRVTDDYGTVGGGLNNQAGDNDGTTSDRSYATVGGGFNNKATGEYATIGGGRNNTVEAPGSSTIGGGSSNTSSGLRSTVAGGESNVASSSGSTIGGGWDNTASGGASTVGGGEENIASGQFSAIPGGSKNTAQGYHSFAAGRRAKATHSGSFVWADPTDVDFATTAENQFLIRANGGVGIGTTSPTQALDVAGTVHMIGFQMPTGATNGYVLTSDGSGVGSWQAASGGGIGGSGSANYIAKFTAPTILGNSLLYENGNYVGIGTTSPARRLHVQGVDNAVPARLSGYSLTSPTTLFTSLEVEVQTSDDMQDGFGPRINFLTSDNTASLQNLGALGMQRAGADNTGDIVFRPATVGTETERMRITAAGNVGIGTTNPAQALDVSGTVQMTGFQMPTGATDGYVLTSDGAGVGTWQAASGSGDDGDWTISGNDIYAAVSGNVGIGTSGAPSEKLVVDGGNLYVKSGNSMLKGGGGGARIEFFHGSYLGGSNSYCEVVIQGANPGDAALVVEAHRIYGNGSGYGAVYGKQTWVVSCEGSTATMPSTIVAYPGEYDEAASDKITLAGENGPVFRVRFFKNYDHDNGSVRIILFGAFDPETTTFSVSDY